MNTCCILLFFSQIFFFPKLIVFIYIFSIFVYYGYVYYHLKIQYFNCFRNILTLFQLFLSHFHSYYFFPRILLYILLQTVNTYLIKKYTIIQSRQSEHGNHWTFFFAIIFPRRQFPKAQFLLFVAIQICFSHFTQFEVFLFIHL